MRYSQTLIPTVKEVPAEAEIPSHQLMIRAGFIRKVASGTYNYLPAGYKSLLKIMAIVREEMNAAGALEILMPILQPMELWQQTGRDQVFKDILFLSEDHHGRRNVFSPTAEETVTALVAGEINSYKQLPVNLYQIHDKFRDEYRPQYGVVRSREFIMKDAYSFDATLEGLNQSYRKMFDAYCRIFKRCGLKYVIVEATSGGMGGTDTEEFMVPAQFGDTLVMTADHSYAANLDKAEVDGLPLTEPAQAARAAAPPMAEVHTPAVGTIEAVCTFLGSKPVEMIKTLIFFPTGFAGVHDDVQRTFDRLLHHVKSVDKVFPELALGRGNDSAIKRVLRFFDVMQNQPNTNEAKRIVAETQALADWTTLREQIQSKVVVVLVRGDHEINVNKLATVVPQSLELASESIIQDVTGAAVGFAGPQGLAGKISKLVIDQAVSVMPVGITGANKTDHHVRNVVPGRDFPLEGTNVVVADVRDAVEGDTYRGKPLLFSHGIEVGHVFKLGTKYSLQLGARFLDEKGQSQPCIMGCYGIGINRILACAIEMEGGHDENGCILPVSIAPFEAEVLPLNLDKPEVMPVAQGIYDELRQAGIDVLIDDRDARPGVKFKDADLLGIPVRVVIGEKNLKDGKVEVKRRTDAKPTLIPVDQAVQTIKQIVAEMKAALIG